MIGFHQKSDHALSPNLRHYYPDSCTQEIPVSVDCSTKDIVQVFNYEFDHLINSRFRNLQGQTVYDQIIGNYKSGISDEICMREISSPKPPADRLPEFCIGSPLIFDGQLNERSVSSSYKPGNGKMFVSTLYEEELLWDTVDDWKNHSNAKNLWNRMVGWVHQGTNIQLRLGENKRKYADYCRDSPNIPAGFDCNKEPLVSTARQEFMRWSTAFSSSDYPTTQDNIDFRVRYPRGVADEFCMEVLKSKEFYKKSTPSPTPVHGNFANVSDLVPIDIVNTTLPAVLNVNTTVLPENSLEPSFEISPMFGQYLATLFFHAPSIVILSPLIIKDVTAIISKKTISKYQAQRIICFFTAFSGAAVSLSTLTGMNPLVPSLMTSLGVIAQTPFAMHEFRQAYIDYKKSSYLFAENEKVKQTVTRSLTDSIMRSISHGYSALACFNLIPHSTPVSLGMISSGFINSLFARKMTFEESKNELSHDYHSTLYSIQKMALLADYKVMREAIDELLRQGSFLYYYFGLNRFSRSGEINFLSLFISSYLKCKGCPGERFGELILMIEDAYNGKKRNSKNIMNLNNDDIDNFFLLLQKSTEKQNNPKLLIYRNEVYKKIISPVIKVILMRQPLSDSRAQNMEVTLDHVSTG